MTAPTTNAVAGSGEGETSDLSPGRSEMDRLLERVAESELSVLITGETGVGKERLAELVCRFSRRAAGPFVRIDCGAFPDSLIESEMFGYELGAFTDAGCSKPGLLETAQGGTVFLDEIGELTPSAQVKLLRLLDERKVLRIGALTPMQLDVRFISATNRDLRAGIERGTFRQDLYFRLNGITLFIPPLRERVSEIASIARTFIANASVRIGAKRVPELSMEALAVLEAYSWPGNVRELRNVIERAVLLSGHEEITPEHLPLSDTKRVFVEVDSNRDGAPEAKTPPVMPAPPPDSPTKREDSARVEPKTRGLIRQEILSALAAAGGNQTRAAQILGISRRTLIKRLDEHNLPRPRKGSGTHG